MQNDILNIANRYAQGLEHVQNRKSQWLTKHKDLKDHLKEIADNLNANSAYKQGFFVDTLHAFDEDMNGTCADLPSVTFRSGDMPMLVSFTNEKKERKEFIEHGFQISFNPSVTGEILVLLLPHFSDLSRAKPQMTPLGIFKNPEEITTAIIDEIISKGMETAYYSSFTGIAEMEAGDATNNKQSDIPHHNPIGFKRYETTEETK